MSRTRVCVIQHRCHMSAWKRYHGLHHPTCYCVIFHIPWSNFIAYFDSCTYNGYSYQSILLFCHLVCKLIFTMFMCVFVNESTNSIRFTRLFPFHQRTIHKFMHDYVAQFTILSKTAQKTTHANTSASKNAKAVSYTHLTLPTNREV